MKHKTSFDNINDKKEVIMNMKDGEFLFISKDLEEKYKDDPEALQEVISYLKWKAERDSSICVIYNPDCGCPLDQFVLLDRFPMSKKIISSCPECKKNAYMEISNPIIFHSQLTDEDFSLKDLIDMVINSSWQEEYLKEYQFYSLIHYLGK